MSDFFYKEKLGAVFSPVLSIKHEKLSPAVVSAIDNLLSPSGDMFTRAQTVRNLMQIESLSLEEASKVLSLKKTDVANKLRLLEFSAAERSAIIACGFSELAALQFLKLDKLSRLYAMEFCNSNGYSDEQIQGYVDGVVSSKCERKEMIEKKIETVKKIALNDVGFFMNSIENAVRIAMRAGFDIEKTHAEKPDGYDIHISVKKKK